MGEERWFKVDSKSFNISKEMVKDKEVVLTVERRQGLSSWIRFSKRGLAMLLEGDELCCGNFTQNPFRMEWKEEGESFQVRASKQ